jgi:hypothetical protein
MESTTTNASNVSIAIISILGDNQIGQQGGGLLMLNGQVQQQGHGAAKYVQAIWNG